LKEIEDFRTKGSFSTDYLNELIRVIFQFENQLHYGATARITGKAMVEGLAHDLRHPLAVLHSCCQFLSEDKKLSSRAKENVQWMGENIAKVNKLISQFLSFSRVCLTFQPINMNESIRKEWEITILRTGNCQILFHTQLAEDLPEVFGDYEKIARVLSNLFLNAVEAVSGVSPEGIVTAHTCFLPSRNMVEVSIMDNGPGIPEKIRKKVFQPYFTTKKEGTGLGLHLSRHFVEEHQGEIFIDSVYKEGAKITVRLPVFMDPGLR
jgi:signal transduction histidine kinase